MRRKLRYGLLFLLIWMTCFPARAFAQESDPVMTGYGNGFLLFENGRGCFVDAAGVRTDLEFPDSAELCFCRNLDDTLYWQDAEGSVWCSPDLRESELLLREMPPAVGVIRPDDTEQIVFEDGRVYDTRSKAKTFLPVESVLIGAEANDCMAVLAEQNGTLWIRRPGGDFNPVRYEELYGVRVRLTDMTVWENTVYICGEKEDGSPFLAGSVMGGVWIERDTAITEDSGTAVLPRCITASEELGALVLGCSDGTAAVLPECVKCSAVYRIADAAVTDIAASGSSLGYITDGEFRVISLNDIPQNENAEKDCPTGC